MEPLKKYIVCILAFLLLRFWLVAPWFDEQKTLETEYATIINVQKRAETLLSESHDISLSVTELEKISARNNAYLFPEDSVPREALSQMQKQVRTLMETSKLEIKSITWGEPQPDTNTALMRLSLAFVVSGDPAAFHGFLNSLTLNRPLLLLETLSITPGRDMLQVTGQIVSFLRFSTTAVKQ